MRRWLVRVVLLGMVCVGWGCAGPGGSGGSESADRAAARAFEPRASRSGWGLVVAGPADGSVRHPVAYYRSAGERVDRPGLGSYHDAEARLLAALSGERPGHWNGPNAAAAVTEPVMAGLETAWLPVAMVVKPPWVMVVE